MERCEISTVIAKLKLRKEKILYLVSYQGWLFFHLKWTKRKDTVILPSAMLSVCKFNSIHVHYIIWRLTTFHSCCRFVYLQYSFISKFFIWNTKEKETLLFYHFHDATSMYTEHIYANSSFSIHVHHIRQRLTSFIANN